MVGFPVVDGRLSIETYYQLLDECYDGFFFFFSFVFWSCY